MLRSRGSGGVAAPGGAGGALAQVSPRLSLGKGGRGAGQAAGGLWGAPAAAAHSHAISSVSRCASADINNSRDPARRGCHEIFIPAVTERVNRSSAPAQAGGHGGPCRPGEAVGDPALPVPPPLLGVGEVGDGVGGWWVTASPSPGWHSPHGVRVGDQHRCWAAAEPRGRAERGFAHRAPLRCSPPWGAGGC